MSEPIIRRYAELPASPLLDAGLDTVFFEASNTRSFADEAVRQAFRERWLGRYLVHDTNWVYVALDPAGGVAGYLAGSLDDPARTARFSDIAYFADFAQLTSQFPAHLHVNLAPASRSRGIGSRLVRQFMADARAAHVPGVHVVTSRGARNVAFYRRNGFREEGTRGEGEQEIVFLAQPL